MLSVIRLSDLYGVSLDQLLKGDDTMLHHIEESTNTVKSRQRLARLLEVLSFLVVWAVCVAVFWLGGGSDAMGYSILVMYLVLPVTTFVCGLLMGLDTSWRERQWLSLLYFGVGYVLLPYGTFSAANMLTTGTFRLPEWQYILYGTVFAMQGLCLGSAIRWGRALRRTPGDKRRPLWVFGVVWGSTAFLLFSLHFYEFAALLLSAVSSALGEVFVAHLRQVLGEALLLLHLAASGARGPVGRLAAAQGRRLGREKVAGPAPLRPGVPAGGRAGGLPGAHRARRSGPGALAVAGCLLPGRGPPGDGHGPGPSLGPPAAAERSPPRGKIRLIFLKNSLKFVKIYCFFLLPCYTETRKQTRLPGEEEMLWDP